MPCNLATSITRCAVPETHLQKLLTDNVEQVVTLVQNYLQQHEAYGKLSPSVTRQGILLRVSFQRRPWFITIRNGQIQMTGIPKTQQRQADEVSRDLTDLLTIVADEFFTEQMRVFVGDTLVSEQDVEVDNEGQRQLATVLKLNL